MKRGRKPKVLSQAMLEQYQRGEVTIIDIGRVEKCAPSTVAICLRRQGAPVRRSGCRRQFELTTDVVEDYRDGRATLAQKSNNKEA